MSQPGGQVPSCPTCRAPLYHESPHQWPVNTVLVDLVEQFLARGGGVIDGGGPVRVHLS